MNLTVDDLQLAARALLNYHFRVDSAERNKAHRLFKRIKGMFPEPGPGPGADLGKFIEAEWKVGNATVYVSNGLIVDYDAIDHRYLIYYVGLDDRLQFGSVGIEQSRICFTTDHPEVVERMRSIATPGERREIDTVRPRRFPSFLL